jgi:hypothetical protein
MRTVLEGRKANYRIHDVGPDAVNGTPYTDLRAALTPEQRNYDVAYCYSTHAQYHIYQPADGTLLSHRYGSPYVWPCSVTTEEPSGYADYLAWKAARPSQ